MVEPLSPMAHDELNINQQGFNSHDPCPGHGKPSRSEALTQPRRGKIQDEQTKTSERPGNRPSVFIIFYDHSVFRLVEILAFATCLHSWWFLLVLHFHWDSWKPLKTLLLLQREFKNACSTPPKSVSFFEWFSVSLQRQHFFTLHTNLRTVLAVVSQTSEFLYMYRHCQALTYVMITGLWLGSLPGSILLQAFQQFFPTIVPVWASTFGLPRRTRRTVFAQRNMKCLHRSAKDVCNVTWHVFSVHQRT